MSWLIAAVLLPLHFTAPSAPSGADAAARGLTSHGAAHAYVFHRLEGHGTIVTVPGYADSTGRTTLTPHAPGTRETVWLAPGAGGTSVTIYVMSLDTGGNLGAASKGWVIGVRRTPGVAAARDSTTRHGEAMGDRRLAGVERAAETAMSLREVNDIAR